MQKLHRPIELVDEAHHFQAGPSECHTLCRLVLRSLETLMGDVWHGRLACLLLLLATHSGHLHQANKHLSSAPCGTHIREAQRLCACRPLTERHADCSSTLAQL